MTKRIVALRPGQRLADLFKEGTLAHLLREDDSLAHESGASGASLDAQVDRYLNEYLAGSKKEEDDEAPPVDQMEALDWRDLLKGRLVEAGESDKDEEDADDQAPGADAMMGDDERLGLDKISVEDFANDVARLIENYDSLLEIRSTLLRRAREFLEETYDDDVVSAFEATMRDDHAMEAGESKLDIDSDKFTAPPADRAQGSAAPGGGGAAV